MDFDEYVAARYGRLIEHAVLLGCPEGEAGSYVDRVLIDQRKRIRRAEDPDPLVHEALERALSGEPERSRRTGPLVAVGVVAVTVAVAFVLTYRPAPDPMPSLFGYDGDRAERLLEDRGYEVLLRPMLVCEPDGLVVATDPIAGTLVRRGATVTVRTASPSEGLCEISTRADAWAFVAFALGGPAPAFARTVRIIVDGSEPTTLSQEAAALVDRWNGVLTLVADAAERPAATATGMPRLIVHFGPPPEQSCGVPRPGPAGDRPALRLTIDARAPNDSGGCPLTVDLYRDSQQVIDAVVVYTAQE